VTKVGAIDRLLRRLVAETERYPGIRIMGVSRDPNSDAIGCEIDLMMREGTVFTVDGRTLLLATPYHLGAEVTRQLDQAAARLRAMLVGQLLNQKLRFADNPDQDLATRRQLAEKLVANEDAMARAMSEVDHALDAAQAELATSAAPPTIRPPLERYVRCTFEIPGGLTVEPGLEYRGDESLRALSASLRDVVIEACRGHVGASDDFRSLNDAIQRAVELAWPGRAWFVEIHGQDGLWTQVFQPYGVPRNGGRMGAYLGEQP